MKTLTQLIVLFILIRQTNCTTSSRTSQQSSSSENARSTPHIGHPDATGKRKRADSDDKDNDKFNKIPGLKVCTKCNTAQSTSEFHKQKRGKNGLMSYCKTCVKAIRATCADCPKRPTFGVVQNQPTHCKKHKSDAMTDVGNKKCADCNKLPNFGLVMGTATHCATHKTTAMVNVNHPRCRECNTQPTFGYVDGKPTYCAKHKLVTMFDVKNNKCEKQGCNKQPMYGYDKLTSCAEHKQTGMKNMRHVLCSESGCTRVAMFGRKGQKALSCSQHALSGMIDVMSTRCSTADCTIMACYGYPGVSRVACTQHKCEGMIYLRNVKCVEKGCGNSCTHGIGIPKWCEAHALSTHHNLVERVCANCSIVDILNTENKCQSCGTNYSAAQKITLRKQKEVKAMLDADPELSGYEFYDQKVTVEQDILCTTTHKPDFLWDGVTHIVILEVDESQHRNPNYQCEKLRMRALAEDLKRPIIFVRFNPDSYKVDNKPQQAGYAQRYKDLKKWLMYSFEATNVKGVIDVIYLYYNEYRSETTETQVVLDKLE